MTCKGCKAIDGCGHPAGIKDFSNAKCGLGYETVIDKGVMIPVHKCEKPKSWKELSRIKRDNSTV